MLHVRACPLQNPLHTCTHSLTTPLSSLYTSLLYTTNLKDHAFHEVRCCGWCLRRRRPGLRGPEVRALALEDG